MPANSEDYFSPESLDKDLKKKTVVAGYALVVFRAIGLILSLASIPILARLLSKGDFGLVAMASVFSGFASMFVDAGLSKATVQSKDLTPEQATNLFWFTTALGTLISVCFALLAWPISWFYGEPRLFAIVCVMSLSYFGVGVTMQHRSLMRRRMQMWTLGVVGLGSQIVAILLSLGWAYWKQGSPDACWALVIKPIVAVYLSSVIFWFLCPWRPGFPKRGVGTMKLTSFGAVITGSNTIMYFITQADFLLVGWYWGDELLGVYERAYRLLLAPIRAISSPLGSATVPALSRLTDKPQLYREAFVKASRASATAQVPVISFIAIYAEETVLCMLGPNWQEAVPVFIYLLPAVFLNVFGVTCEWVYHSWGHVSRQFKWVVFSGTCFLATYAATVSFGIEALAIGYSIIFCLLRVPAIFICFHGTPVRFGDLVRSYRLPALSAAVASVGTLFASASTTALNDFARIGVGVPVFGCVYFATLLVSPTGRELLRDLGLARVFRLKRS
ncbi:MAG: lipopolysaccharide biosynthesis protein [Planctomycetota bacterium]